MQLISISVKGFRSLKDIRQIPIGSPTVLTGQNDGGKSATISALSYLLGNYSLTEEDPTYAEPSAGPREPGGCPRVPETYVKGTFLVSLQEQELFQESGLEPVGSSIEIRRRSERDGPTLYELLARVCEQPDLRDLGGRTIPELKALLEKFGIPTPRGKKAEIQAALREYRDSLPTTEDWTVCPRPILNRLPLFLSFIGESRDPEETVRQALTASYQSYLKDETFQGTIASIESTLSERVQRESKSLQEHIKSRVDLSAIKIIPDVSLSVPRMAVRVEFEKRPGQRIPLSYAGSGRRQRVLLAVWEWTSDLVAGSSKNDGGSTHAVGDLPSATVSNDTDELDGQINTDEIPPDFVIAYDEPDTHLDYGRQRELIRIIREQCARPNVKMLVATHSMNLIDRVDIRDVVHVRLGDDQLTTVEQLTELGHDATDDHLHTISTALGLRTSVLLHERCFVGLEGETEQQAFPILFRIYKELPMQSLGIVPLACGNNEGALNFARFLHLHHRKVVFLVDKDSLHQKRRLFSEDKLRSYGLDPNTQARYLGNPNELEDLFSDEQWATAANELWPRDDEQPWTSDDISRHRDGKFSAALQEEFQRASSTGPGGKPEMVTGLARLIASPEEIPTALAHAFDWLCENASSATPT